jgi:hypothetical protein
MQNRASERFRDSGEMKLAFKWCVHYVEYQPKLVFKCNYFLFVKTL